MKIKIARIYEIEANSISDAKFEASQMIKQEKYITSDDLTFLDFPELPHKTEEELEIKISQLKDKLHRRNTQIKELKKKVAFAIQELKEFGSVEAVQELIG
ncbi:hypothetical protein LCGC14_1929460 [marine sediment metagenome]|uniref:Uncharacterized protein n=1 Tax=marine sediment metagenome TaxID=412755 RepID=A0A0F9FP21_9ZZZZ